MILDPSHAQKAAEVADAVEGEAVEVATITIVMTGTTATAKTAVIVIATETIRVTVTVIGIATVTVTGIVMIQEAEMTLVTPMIGIAMAVVQKNPALIPMAILIADGAAEETTHDADVDPVAGHVRAEETDPVAEAVAEIVAVEAVAEIVLVAADALVAADVLEVVDVETTTATIVGDVIAIATANQSRSMIRNWSKALACWNCIPTDMVSCEVPRKTTLVTAAIHSFPAR